MGWMPPSLRKRHHGVKQASYADAGGRGHPSHQFSIENKIQSTSKKTLSPKLRSAHLSRQESGGLVHCAESKGSAQWRLE